MTGNKLDVYRDKFVWNNGLVVKDWRYVSRGCNIDVSDLIANSGSQAKLTEIMIKMIHRIPNIRAGKAAFYMNRTLHEMLDIQRLSGVTAGGGLTYDNVDGKQVMSFRAIPLRTVDQLLETEGRVT